MALVTARHWRWHGSGDGMALVTARHWRWHGSGDGTAVVTARQLSASARLTGAQAHCSGTG